MSIRTFASNCLRDRVVLITGGCGAIGEVVVRGLISFGASVGVVDIIDPEEAMTQLRGSQPASDRLCYVCADISSEKNVAVAFDSVEASLGQVNVAMAHAGTVEAHPAEDWPLESFDAVMNVNLRGAFLTAREAARRMKGRSSAQQPGRILFTSSWVEDVPWPQIGPYSASKAGLRMLMRTMARELVPYHILVNGIAPGIVAVGLAKRQWDTDRDYRARASKAIPVGHMQPPESIADAVIFLCSDAANYMVGSTLLVDGGCSTYPMI
jgi:NAD(P)-dependent dehydrogenase (short-subunit alcohol dehydrogenase family)